MGRNQPSKDLGTSVTAEELASTKVPRREWAEYTGRTQVWQVCRMLWVKSRKRWRERSKQPALYRAPDARVRRVSCGSLVLKEVILAKVWKKCCSITKNRSQPTCQETIAASSVCSYWGDFSEEELTRFTDRLDIGRRGKERISKNLFELLSRLWCYVFDMLKKQGKDRFCRSWKFCLGHVNEMHIRNSSGNIKRSIGSKSQFGVKLKAREIKLRITENMDIL